jgi:ribosomal protein S15P/S13E
VICRTRQAHIVRQTPELPPRDIRVVNEDFDALFRFLEEHAEDVSGRAALDVSASLRQQLAKFAAGECNEQEREQLKTLLQNQPELIPILVKEVHTRRESTL